MQGRTFLLAVVALVAGAGPGARSTVAAHDGPPFPIVSNHAAGSYEIDVWTDPDATDDRSAGGQFWVIVEPAGESGEPPAGTAVTVSIRPVADGAAWLTKRAEPVDGRLSRHFAALVMDHEGRFDVRVEVEGPLGPAVAAAWVDATYDLRPPPVMLLLYLMPFVVVGVLWTKRLIRRRRAKS
jgi:hypothetical protein